MNAPPRHWALIPAAGVGRRLGGAIPKQYLPLAGRPLIEYSLEILLNHPRIEAVVVALGPEDGWWPDTAFARHPMVVRAEGGAERCHSVRNGLELLWQRGAAPKDWVLVHDAARPCLRRADLDRLLERLGGHPVGGLLGVPARDTMKRADEVGEVRETVPRAGLWHAYTPQMFRLGPLCQALDWALEQGLWVTDEASAMELAGYHPLLVEGHADNIKVTLPEDLALAAFHLSQRAEG